MASKNQRLGLELLDAMRSEIDPGISRVLAALSLLGQPQVALRGRCLHVAGTNGKGSVCAMLYAVCRPRKMKSYSNIYVILYIPYILIIIVIFSFF